MAREGYKYEIDDYKVVYQASSQRVAILVTLYSVPTEGDGGMATYVEADLQCLCPYEKVESLTSNRLWTAWVNELDAYRNYLPSMTDQEHVDIVAMLHRAANDLSRGPSWPSQEHIEREKFANETAKTSKRLPNVLEWVRHPEMGTEDALRDIIIDLNDSRGWSREQIADWLDSLHDEGVLDLAFHQEENSGHQE